MSDEPEPVPSAKAFVQSLVALADDTKFLDVRNEALGQLLACIWHASVAFNDACDYGLLRRHDCKPAHFEQIVRKHIGVSCLNDIFRTLGFAPDARFLDGKLVLRQSEIGEGIARPCLEEWGQKLRNDSWRKTAAAGDKVKEDGLASMISEISWHLELVRTDRSGDVLHSLALLLLPDERRKAFFALRRISDATARERARDEFLRSDRKTLRTEIKRLGPRTKKNALPWARAIVRFAARGYLVHSHVPPGSSMHETVRRDAESRSAREVDRSVASFVERYGMAPQVFLDLPDGQKPDVLLKAGVSKGEPVGVGGKLTQATQRAYATVERTKGEPTEGHWVAAWAKVIGPRMKTLPRV